VARRGRAKRGLTLRWHKGDRTEFVPFNRDAVVVWRDRFGSVRCAGWGPLVDPDSEAFNVAVRYVIVSLGLNPIIEPSADERLDG